MLLLFVRVPLSAKSGRLGHIEDGFLRGAQICRIYYVMALGRYQPALLPPGFAGQYLLTIRVGVRSALFGGRYRRVFIAERIVERFQFNEAALYPSGRRG